MCTQLFSICSIEFERCDAYGSFVVSAYRLEILINTCLLYSCVNISSCRYIFSILWMLTDCKIWSFLRKESKRSPNLSYGGIKMVCKRFWSVLLIKSLITAIIFFLNSSGSLSTVYSLNYISPRPRWITRCNKGTHHQKPAPKKTKRKDTCERKQQFNKNEKLHQS